MSNVIRSKEQDEAIEHIVEHVVTNMTGPSPALLMWALRCVCRDLMRVYGLPEPTRHGSTRSSVSWRIFTTWLPTRNPKRARPPA
jgi:hypothetical protein